MDNFIKALKNTKNKSLTENGAISLNSTSSNILNLFARIGAMRNVEHDEILNIFIPAYNENKDLSLKTLFYARDILQGLGERRVFKIIMKYLGLNFYNDISNLIKLIPEYGRWDDLYIFIGTPLEKEVFEIIKSQFQKDINSDSPSLLGKWLKSENTSSKKSRKIATKIRIYLGLSSKEYRKSLSKLRKKINVVESKMSTNKWNDIEYSNVPSIASMKYANAFGRHDEERYTKYINNVKAGIKKINAKTLYPYQIIEKIIYHNNNFSSDALEQLWKSLPNYIENNENNIAVVDVSGSMYGNPICVAISLGLYLAERNTGAFKNKFITFSEKPRLVEIEGDNLYSKISNIGNEDWGCNTNLEAIFNLILEVATINKLNQQELPKKLYIISDMEFDNAIDNTSSKTTLFHTIKNKFDRLGYKMPEIVFWNVDSRNAQFPVSKDEYGTTLVSGCSPIIFKNVLEGNELNPMDYMLSVINTDRYSNIKVTNEKN